MAALKQAIKSTRTMQDLAEVCSNLQLLESIFPGKRCTVRCLICQEQKQSYLL